MSGLDQAGQFIWILGGLVLVGSAFIAHQRQMPRERFLLMMGIWIAIFAAGFGIAHMLDQRG